MKNLAKSLANRLAALHRDEQGADMIEYILIVAIVSLPLLGVLIYYWHDIARWTKDEWDKAKGGGEVDPGSL